MCMVSAGQKICHVPDPKVSLGQSQCQNTVSGFLQGKCCILYSAPIYLLRCSSGLFLELMYVEQRVCSHQPALFRAEPTVMCRTVIEAYLVIGACKTEAVSCMLYLDCSHL
jgi:hypothetical protein